MSDLLSFSVVVVVVLLLSYALGWVVLFFLKCSSFKEPFFALFSKLFTGLTCIIVSYALICTSGVTVLLPMPIILLITLNKIKNYSPGDSYSVLSKSRVFADLSIIIIFGVIAVIYRYYALYDTESGQLLTPFQDYVYYSRLTMPLNVHGVETNSMEALYPKFVTEQPYHYYELWLNAAIVRYTKLASVWSLCICSYAILLTVVCIGFASILAHFKVNRLWVMLISPILLTVTGVQLNILSTWPPTAYGHLMAGWMLVIYPKTAPVYLCLIFIVLSVLKGKKNTFFIPLSLLPLVYISTLPVVILSLIFISIIYLLIYKISVTKILNSNIIIIIVTIYIALFYILQPALNHNSNSTGFSELASNIVATDLAPITYVNIVLGSLLNYILYYFVYLIITTTVIFYTKNKTQKADIKELIIIFSACMFSSLIIRAITTHNLDSWQFFSNIMVPLSGIIFAVILSTALSKNNVVLNISIFSLLVFIYLFNGNRMFINPRIAGATQYSAAFLKKIAIALSATSNRGGYILNKDEYLSPYMMSSDSHTAGTYVSNFKNNYLLLSLSAIDMKPLVKTQFSRDSVYVNQVIKNTTLSRYYITRNLQHASIDSVKYSFVMEQNLTFICASPKGNLPKTILPLVKAMYVDELSGERLYILKRKHDFKYDNHSI